MNLLHCPFCHETGEGDFLCRCRREARWTARMTDHVVRLAELDPQWTSDPEACLRRVAEMALPKGTEYELVSIVGKREPLFLITTVPEDL